MQKFFNPKFTCARTKCEAIVTNVLCPYIMNQVKTELKDANFVTVFTDASNHKDVKLFPLMIRYFVPLAGVKVKILDMQSLPGETAQTICKFLVDALQRHGLTEKVVGFCADNANTNFGGLKRRGRNNVFAIMQDDLGRKLLGIGCAAHIVHNAIQTAGDCLPIDVEAVIMKIYYYFYIYTVRVQSFTEFCDFADVEYQRILGYGKTRWLSLMPAVERVLKLFPALKSYFLSEEKCPTLIRNFFENPCAELWLYFVHNIAAVFHATILRIEAQTVTALEVSSALDDLIHKCTERSAKVFLPNDVRVRITQLEEEGMVRKNDITRIIVNFYDNCAEYLKQRVEQFEDLNAFSWVALKETTSWEKVQESLPLFGRNIPNLDIDDNELFDEVSYVSQFASPEKIADWDCQKTSVDCRWVEIFRHSKAKNVPCAQIQKIVEFVLCLPGTNAVTERVFSAMNIIWTSEKTQLKVETLEAMLMVKCNFEFHESSCDKVYETLLQEPKLLRSIHSSMKYVYGAPAQNDPSRSAADQEGPSSASN